MADKQILYDSIKNVIHEPTRKILYIQFISKYYPEAYEALLGHNKLIIPVEEQSTSEASS